ncbi:MAG TPA: tRNA (5-methylaminomethyl-2-thiouridine)(34)-methyltransferase MnmD [Chitinophagaceae bacterium]|nr:tRNA (5-methylaminomethyl-2-thiouridine)(34)-methyltransferase MnmD [Chitinophagaceae bacterium]
MNLTFHSIHGAIRESKHVFIQEGLLHFINRTPKDVVSIFEVGLGTGLNALLTAIEIEKLGKKVYYEAVELFPLEIDLSQSLNYCEQLEQNELKPMFEQIHTCVWETEITIRPGFVLRKIKKNLLNFEVSATFDLIYFDAFAPNEQPELWTKEIFDKMLSLLSSGGILVTYSSKGSVQRTMRSSGFKVEKIPGPPGKREMIRASALND